MPNNQEIRWNMKAVENAIAQQRLEGLEPSAAVVFDLKRAAAGDLSVRDVLDNIGKRREGDKIRNQR